MFRMHFTIIYFITLYSGIVWMNVDIYGKNHFILSTTNLEEIKRLIDLKASI